MRPSSARSLLLASALAAITAGAAEAAEPASGDAAPARAEPPEGAAATQTATAGAVPAASSAAPAPTGVPARPPGPVTTPARSFPPTVAPLSIERPDASARVGVLVQPQYQRLGDAAYTGDAQNLYVRRARFILGGTLFGMVDYFLDTDYPDLFLAKAASGTPSVKYTPQMVIQDVFVTVRPFGSVVMVDAGYFLPPMAHNAVQSAATLFSWDYFAYSFQHDQALGSLWSPIITPAGRDAGVELRGLVARGHLEYRVGLFQGLRGPNDGAMTGARNGFRVTSRIQLNLLDPEPGFFYAGTYLGARRILSIGGSYDFQNSFTHDYLYLAGDAFLDLPVGPGVVTAQVNVAHWNGHQFTQMMLLQEQTAVMAEAGYTIIPARLSPIVRFEHLEGPEIPPQDRYSGGLAFWPFGHHLNLKAFYTRITQQPPPPMVHAANALNIQLQVYYF